MDRRVFRDLLLLIAIVIIAAIGARILARGETLEDYAARNPEEALVASATEISSSETIGTQPSDVVEVASAQDQGITPVDTPSTSNGAEIQGTESQTVDDNSTVENPTEQESTAESASKDQPAEETTTEDISSNEITSEEKSMTNDSAATTSNADNTSDTNIISDIVTTDSITTSTTDTENTNPDRVTYADGFYYEPISNDIFKRISGISYPVDCTVPLSDLRYVVLQYIDFNGNPQNGEMICGTSIVQDVVEIFHELYVNGYQIESIKLIDEFGGDDTASMLANNTSCFNFRVVEGTTRLSNHARGVAIDINPFYNPYITYNKDGTAKISPVGSEAYADRNASFPYKIDENDLAYKLFKKHGFTWGGNWNSAKDYQHFEKK